MFSSSFVNNKRTKITKFRLKLFGISHAPKLKICFGKPFFLIRGKKSKFFQDTLGAKFSVIFDNLTVFVYKKFYL